MLVRSLPVREPICSAERFNSRPRRSKATAVSIGLRSSRWIFSTRVISRRRSSGISLNHNGNIREAGEFGRAPSALPRNQLIAGAGAADDEWLDDSVGADGLGELRQAVRVEDAARLEGVRIDGIDGRGERPGRGADWISGWGTGGAWVRVARSACRPLPSTLRGFSVLFMVEKLFGELNVAFSALGPGVVDDDGFPEAGRFRQADAARDDGLEDLGSEELL